MLPQTFAIRSEESFVAVEIVMPHLSDSMEEGTILQWLVAEGDAVAEGEPLVEVETDKASVTYEAEQDGTLLKIAVGAGETAAVGSIIAVIGTPGEEISLPDDAAGDRSAGGATPAGAADAAVAGERSAEYGARSGGTVVVVPPSNGVSATRAEAVGGAAASGDRPAVSGGRVKASPLARRIAAELGVDLATLTGTGPQGRVVRADVERSAQGVSSIAAPVVSGRGAAAISSGDGADGASAVRGAKGETTRHDLSRLQQTIARRMSESRATVPDFELRAEVDMSEAVALREQMRSLTERPPSINDFIVKAAALALREFPRVNGAYRDGSFEQYSRVNVGIAVAADDALVVPTIFDADEKSLGAIAASARALAAKVRDGSISPAELSGGTFSISNLGMFGVDSFSAVLNTPQSAILAVGSLKQRPVVDETDPAHPVIVARPTVQLTLACDHRILYGADGARFLTRLRELLQAPLALLVG
jgi:pyruvate dehydrogenase E2 component (dihydrolipoamide acetyltransferase)